MTTPDEPLPIPVDESDFEEVSPELIVDPGETLPGAVLADTDAAAPSSPSSRRAPAAAPPSVPVARITTPSPQRAVAPAASREHVHVRARPSPATEADATRPVATPRAAPPRAGFPLAVALVFLVVGAGGGFFAGRLWEQRAAAGAHPPAGAAPATATTRAPGQPAPKRAPSPATPRQPARTPRTPAPTTPTAMGKLTVTAPAAAEILLDGRRIGKGSLTADVAPGPHRIDVRLGGSRVTERFEVGPNETWTYDVTPTN